MLRNLSIKKQLQIGFFFIMTGSIVLTLFTMIIGINYLIENNDKVKPANYYEQQLPIIEDYINKKGQKLLDQNEQESLEQIIPREGITYQVLDSEGRKVYGTLSVNLISPSNPLIHNINEKVHSKRDENNLTYYVPLLSQNNNLIGAVGLNYDIKMSYSSTWPLLIVVGLISSPFIYIILLTLFISNIIGKRVSTPIHNLIEASNRIKNKDLNFKIEYDVKNEIGDLTSSFEQMRNELEISLTHQWKLEQDKRDYLKAISHDLKTPLTIIKGHAEGLLEGLWKNEKLLFVYLQTITSNVDRTSKLLNDINLVTELDSFSFKLFLHRVKIKPFFKEQLTNFSYLADKKQIALAVSVKNDHDVEIFTLDKERISQVIDNILMNSLRFTPYKGTIQIDIDICPDELSFHVHDSGPGISLEENMTKIFGKFHQENHSQSTHKGHSGLGLYIAKTIIEKHNGSISARNSIKYGGAHIWFTIPNHINT
ncbi:sensor histidine kinase [Metabacillus halosaccharovorans]|uniref:sensor histidine kinase n=1 Tax=Metabacillus halosaccharovorans TaxID=930124 RepID=UPI0037360F36